MTEPGTEAGGRDHGGTEANGSCGTSQGLPSLRHGYMKKGTRCLLWLSRITFRSPTLNGSVTSVTSASLS